jgi:hypothetical protein
LADEDGTYAGVLIRSITVKNAEPVATITGPASSTSTPPGA